MPVLTRRRDPDAQQETWLIYYGVDRWAWSCGFYPASHRGVRADGSARTFEDAHADFEEAWHRLLPEVTKKELDKHRRYRALEAWKRAMWETGCKLPTQVTDGLSRCFCGAPIEIKNVEHHVYAAHLIRWNQRCHELRR
jgi:hypothetical protein